MENEWVGWLYCIGDVRYYIFYRASFASYQNTKIWDAQVTYGKGNICIYPMYTLMYILRSPLDNFKSLMQCNCHIKNCHALLCSE